jgi:hypothetical protein
VRERVAYAQCSKLGSWSEMPLNYLVSGETWGTCHLSVPSPRWKLLPG